MANAERVLFVHAHPDDETIDTGGTIATLVDRGAQVTVLTATRGERGEVIPEDLQHTLESKDAVAELRESELDAAMKILGVTDHRYLGDDNARWSGQSTRAYVDSGMRWGKRGAEATDDSGPTSLAAADFAEVTSDIASVLIAVGPDAVVSYDERGGYGHPDHVRVHDAARRAADIYGVPFFTVLPELPELPTGTQLGWGRPAASPTISVDVSGVLDRKRKALAAFRSQLALDGDTIVFPGGQRQAVSTVERYALLDPESAEPIAFADQHPAARFAVAVLAGVIGVAFGGLLSVYNQSTALIAGQNIWVGVIAATAVITVLFAGLRLAFGTRVVPGFAAVGAIVIVGLLSVLGLGGSVIIPWNGPGIVWQVAPTIVAIIVLAWPRRARTRPGKLATHASSTAPVSAPSSASQGISLKGPQQP